MLLRTKSFTIAVYAKGNMNAQKLALVLPGRLDSKDYPHMRAHVNYLAQRGYYALTFDPPGTWESPGDIYLYTTTNYLTTIHELIEQFGNRPTLLFGHSRGGGIAILAATNPHVIGVVAAMARPAPSMLEPTPDPQKCQIVYRDSPHDPANLQQFDLPISYFQDSAKYSVQDALKHCQKPKLFLLGLHDSIITPHLVRTSFARAAGPKVLREIASGHNYRRSPRAIDQVNQALGQFLDTLVFN